MWSAGGCLPENVAALMPSGFSSAAMAGSDHKAASPKTIQRVISVSLHLARRSPRCMTRLSGSSRFPYATKDLPPSAFQRRSGPFDDRGRALGEQFQADRAAELTRPVGGTAAGDLDEGAAGFVEHRRGQCHLRAVDGGESGDR